MPSQYAPLPNPRADPDAELEMDAAFDDSDDEGDESHPLNPAHHSTEALPSLASPSPLHAPGSSSFAGAGAGAPGPAGAGGVPRYDFENADYDYPPPGSPPPPSAQAFPNDFGNSNGLVPPTPVETYSGPRRRGGWFGRTAAAILPAHYAQRLGGDGAEYSALRGSVGGGTQNDGVFANVSAKPGRAVRVQDGDETYLVPEEVQKDLPPSYQAAQADAVPPYWETTVHVPGSSVAGEVVVEGLATGSVFSFLWNLLVSVSFQFVGFLLTYLLHTTHAARLGSRAGLGITLIQYGFALRKAENWGDSEGGSDSDLVFGGIAPPAPTFATAKEAEEYYRNHNATMDAFDAMIPSYAMSDTATEWLAFFLMTIGWFVLLTSVLGFWRVKRWERSILASTPGSTEAAAQAPSVLARMFPRLFGARGGEFLRQGLGMHVASDEDSPDFVRFAAAHNAAHAGASRDVDDLYFGAIAVRAPADAPRPTRPGETQFVIDEADPERATEQARGYVAESRLQRDLMAAGLL